MFSVGTLSDPWNTCRLNSCRWRPIGLKPVGSFAVFRLMRSVLLALLPLVLAPSAALA